MEYSEFSSILVRYGLDVAVISLVVAAACFILKRTVLKERYNIAVLIAYAAGAVIYAVYKSIAESDAMFALVNLTEVLERALAIGTLANLICTALEKFTGGDGGLEAIAELISGLVTEEKLKECAKALLAAIDGGAEALAAILAQYAENADEEEIESVAENICEAYGQTTTE